MWKSSFYKYFLLVTTPRPLDSTFSILLRPARSSGIKFHRHELHTSSRIFSTVTSNDELNTTDEAKSAESPTPKKFPCPDGSKLLRVALIGKPNAGKSTLINSLMEIDVCPASMRPHTTRKTQRAIYLEEDTQIVFVDTPGVVNQKEIHKFGFSRDFAMGPRKSIKSAHLVAVMHDVSNRLLRNKLDSKITTLLDQYPQKPVVLILNKVDLVPSKRKLLDVLALLTNGMIGGKPIPVHHDRKKESQQKILNTDNILEKAALKRQSKESGGGGGDVEVDSYVTRSGMTSIAQLTLENANKLSSGVSSDSEQDEDLDVRGWSNFQEVFMMSSLTGEGMESFKKYLIKQAKIDSWDYPEEVLTDYSPMDLTLLTLKSKILDHCEKDVPYKMTPQLEIWEENDKGDLTIVIGIQCKTTRVLTALIGSKGSTIASITHETEKSLMKLLRRNLSIHLKAACPEEKSKT